MKKIAIARVLWTPAAVLIGALVIAFGGAASAAPVNDACTAATTVAAGTRFEETVDTTTATTDLDDPPQSCTVGGAHPNARSIWYRFTAPTNGILSVYTLNTAFPADPPTIVSVHTATCGALSEVDCYDSPTPIASYLHTDVSSGVTYWIDVTNEAGSPGGTVEVLIYFDPDSPICPHEAGDFHDGKSTLTFSTQAGNERVQLAARLALREPLGDVTSSGFQLLVEDDDGYAPIIEWSARTLAIPPGGPGTGCDPKDGWTAAATGASYRYRNISNALPPACTPGSANGLSLVRLHRRPTDPRDVDVKVTAGGTTFASSPVGLTSVRVAVTLEATIGVTSVDRCAASFFPFDCAPNGSGSKLVCKQ